MTEALSARDRPTVRLKRGGDKRARRGHPWIYSNEIEMTAPLRALPPGIVLRVEAANGAPLGLAFFNPHPLIGARLLSRNADDDVGQAFFARRVSSAVALRERLFEVPFYRLVHAEADGLPGLVIDRFGDALSVQPNCAGAETALPQILGALDEVIDPKTVVVRRDSHARQIEGLEVAPPEIVKGGVSGPIRLEENGCDYFADLLAGQKTGWFYDHRENRAFAARLSQSARVLDLYCHSGGFGVLAAAKGAEAVTLCDRSELALDLAKGAADANKVTERCAFLRGEAFETLERLHAAGERFDVAVADPPAFVKSRRDLNAGLKGYRKLARLAAPLISPGGFLLLASCSHNVGQDAFLDECAHGIGLAGRSGRLIRAAGAGPDHPVHPQLPESAYLKALAFQLD